MQLEVFGSTDGKVFRKIGETDLSDIALVQGRNRIVSKIPCAATGLTKIRVKAKLLHQIPKGHHKAGDKAYLKIDEIIVF
ncbi:hypothetical protein [Arenibacter nanhaiticus]|uniref:hypothetical protein n=1 Tax=Arenibacter nanhaiticus TaxID=558155 RepID=UPI000933210D|nr:hypothetical protein [Arenibacter nanhaiticus]